MPAISTLVDNFDDGTMDASKWVRGTLSNAFPDPPNASVAESGGTLRIQPTASVAVYDGYLSVGTYDLTGDAITVKALRGSNAQESFMGLHVGLSASNYVVIALTGDLLECSIMQGGSQSWPVSSTGMVETLGTWQYLRLREVSGHIYWDTSPNGSTWTNRYDWSSPSFAYTACYVSLEGGQWAGFGPSALEQFDDLNILAGGPVSGSGGLTIVRPALAAAATNTPPAVTSSGAIAISAPSIDALETPPAAALAIGQRIGGIRVV